jgi:hypothetical protein
VKSELELESGEARVYLKESMARQSGRMSFTEQAI